MDKAHPLSTLMVDCSFDVENDIFQPKDDNETFPMVDCLFDVEKDIFQPKDDNEKLLGLEMPYLSIIVAQNQNASANKF